jgi:hypothetical protein
MVIAGLVCGFVDSALGMGYGVSATTFFYPLEFHQR